MSQHRGSILRLACAAWLLSLWSIPAIAQSGTSQNQLAGTSNDSILWAIVGEWNRDDKTFLNWLAYLDKSSEQIHPVIGIRPQTGRVIRTAVVGESLHIFFESGAHQRYTRTAAHRELRLPDLALPDAIAGESSGKLPKLWAVVKNDTAQKVASAWESAHKRTTQPAANATSSTQPNTMPVLINLDPDAYHLIIYNGSEWAPGFVAAPGTAGCERLWLCVAGERFHLFWQNTKQDSDINYAWYDNKQWTAGPKIPLPHAPQDATANLINRQLVFTAMIPDHDQPQQLRCETWLRQAGSGDKPEKAFWNELPSPKDEDGNLLVLPTGSAAVAFADNNLAVLRMGEKEAEIGFWQLTSGKQDQPFRSIPIRKKGGEVESPRGIQDIATTLIVALILLLVFWRRQGNFSISVSLPGEYAIARPGKRALAALIDLAPAALIVAWWWRVPLAEFADEVNRIPEQIEVWSRQFFWAFVTFRLIYTGYCMVFELIGSRTPGKRVMGCSVLSESLTPPTPLQIAIRNLTRLIELEPHLLIWPFMLVIFITRDRQRIGDLLARTIVVEKNPIMSDLVKTDSEAQSKHEER